MKSQEEIQKVHDQLTGILLEESLRVQLPPGASETLQGAANVLCWVLDHNHNSTFFDNVIEKTEKWTEARGYKFNKVS
jgi:hypothetical protein